MENNLSIFLTALLNHPVRLATSFLLVAGAVYAAGSTAGLGKNSSMASGLIAGSIFTYINTVNTPRARSNDQEEVARFNDLKTKH